jgi:response regulator RpfG family c-di-GMP phosphodiesterase
MTDASPPSSALARILIVDDDPRTLAALRRALAKEPYEVTTAEEPRIALRWLQNREVSLVISDRRMPDMVGDRFLCQVRRRSPRTALVLLTAYPEAAPGPPFVTLLSKPWDDAQLRATVRQLLQEREEAFGPDPGEGEGPSP